MPATEQIRRITREVPVGNIIIGGEHPIVIQSMTATKTLDIDGTVDLVNKLEAAGAGIVRIAVDSPDEAKALEEIRGRTSANLSVDLQEGYRLAKEIAPYVDKIRYNPGHLYHHERSKPLKDKLATIADIADKNNCALRVGVNCGSVDPELAEKYGLDSVEAMIESASINTDILDRIGFKRYVVSLKDSDPYKVIEANMQFAKLRPEVPLHLGVTEAGLPPQGIIKTHFALQKLLGIENIGETLRVSLTVPNELKHLEIEAGRQIIEDIKEGKFLPGLQKGLNIVSCPSCSRVENSRFVDLAQRIQAKTAYAKDVDLTIPIMGCRVNGPGETSNGDLGIWCGPNGAYLKAGEEELGYYTYEDIEPAFLERFNQLITDKQS